MWALYLLGEEVASKINCTVRDLRWSCVGFEVLKAMAIKMPSSGRRRRVGLLQTDDSEEHVSSIFRVEEINLSRPHLPPLFHILTVGLTSPQLTYPSQCSHSVPSMLSEL
jgi:hypothetical protein